MGADLIWDKIMERIKQPKISIQEFKRQAVFIRLNNSDINREIKKAKKHGLLTTTLTPQGLILWFNENKNKKGQLNISVFVLIMLSLVIFIIGTIILRGGIR